MANAMNKCGYCQFGNAHDRCPGGVRNGDGSIVLCGCGCANSLSRRCTDCGNRTDGEVSERWHCIDRDACMAEAEARAAKNPTIQNLRATSAALVASRDADGAETPARAPRSSRPKRSTSGECLCCGEATKGGKFLPGHDSKYLNTLVELAESDPGAAADAATKVSEAFAGKLKKRVG